MTNFNRHPYITNRMGRRQPCERDCPRRSAECRGTCQAWAEWEAFKAESYRQREVQNAVNDVHRETSMKIERFRLKHGSGRKG